MIKNNYIKAELNTSMGRILLELMPEYAPNTVNNFIYLLDDGFYDTLIFHRVIPGFMIQGGDPTGTGIGGPGYSIRGEFAANGFKNDLKHTEGVISMARSADYNSAGSQFFIMDANAPHLDGQYAAFGKVVEGMNVVHEIARISRDANDRPISPCFINDAFVYLNGRSCVPPEKV